MRELGRVARENIMIWGNGIRCIRKYRLANSGVLGNVIIVNNAND